MNMLRALRPRSRQRGSATLELGLLSVPIMILIFGAADAGRALHQYNTLAKSVRDAARYRATTTPGGDTGVVRCLAATATKDCTGAALVPGLTAGDVEVRDRVSHPPTHNLQATGRGVLNLVTVTIPAYQFTSMVPFVMPSVTFSPISASMPQPL